MKIRNGFVSNSSSTSFAIKNNNYDEEKTIVDFVKDNIYLLDLFNSRYDANYTPEELISSAKARLSDDPELYIFKPLETKELVFGDEQNDVIGKIYDYILRDGSKDYIDEHWHIMYNDKNIVLFYNMEEYSKTLPSLLDINKTYTYFTDRIKKYNKLYNTDYSIDDMIDFINEKNIVIDKYQHYKMYLNCKNKIEDMIFYIFDNRNFDTTIEYKKWTWRFFEWYR